MAGTVQFMQQALQAFGDLGHGAQTFPGCKRWS
jgi:hypothetical protein